MGEADTSKKEPSRSRVTIKDVAREAIVSVTTASVVLNSRLTALPIGEEARQRVLVASAALGYLPNPFAQSLRTGRSRTLGVMVTTITDPITDEVVHAVDVVARERGYHTLLMLSGMGLAIEGQPPASESIAQRFVDGMLVSGFQLVGYAPFPGVAQRHRGSITAIANISGLPSFSVDVDMYRGVSMALRHLHALGHRRLGIIYDPRHEAMRDRCAAFNAFVQEAGLPRVPGYIQATEAGYYEGGQLATAQILALPIPPTAILAANDQMALGAIHAAWRRGVRVPDDLSIVGVDDVAMAGYLVPPLTTVRQPIAEMGRRATEVLIDLLEGRCDPLLVADLLLPPELVIRASCAPPQALSETGLMREWGAG